MERRDFVCNNREIEIGSISSCLDLSPCEKYIAHLHIYTTI